MLRKLAATACVFFTITNCYAASVGDSIGGGTVFCVSDTEDSIKNCRTDKGASGDYGLIMANEDQANLDSPNKGITWSKEYSVTNAQSNDDGAANTKIIITARPNDDASNNAAWLCHNYKDLEDPNADWYLPSKDELNKMYTYAKANNLIGKNCAGSKAGGGVQCLVGGYNDDYKIYWSSTELAGDSEYYAWSQYFSGGYQHGYLGKTNYHLGVRAIRVFNPSTLQHFVFKFKQNPAISKDAEDGR